MGGKGSTGTGVTVFGADEVDRADPGAQTAISPSITDSANLESVGSGSGLLDLTRESDDTSLGALALDQTGAGAPAPKGRRPAAAAMEGTATGATLAFIVTGAAVAVAALIGKPKGIIIDLGVVAVTTWQAGTSYH